MQLRAQLATAEATVLARALELTDEPIPVGYSPSRMHLVRLAHATKELATAVHRTAESSNAPGHSATGNSVGPKPWLPSRNTLRIIVFAAAMLALIIAGSVPRQG